MGQSPGDLGIVDDMDRLEAEADAAEARERQEQERALAAVQAAAVGPWHVRAAVEQLLRRIAPGGGGPVAFPWPGCDAGWPSEDDPDDPFGFPVNAALPPEGASSRPSWKKLWRLAGPLAPDRLAVLVGPTGRGKSAFALQVTESTAAAGFPVLYMSAEMGPDELVARLIGYRARGTRRGPLPWRSVLRGRVSIREVEEAGELLAQDCPGLYLWAPDPGQRSPEALATMTRAVAAVHSQPPLVVVDYLQRMIGSRGDGRRVEVADLSGELRSLSRPDPTRNWPGAGILALSSTARDNYKLFADVASLRAVFEKTPDDLVGTGKETGEIEYDAGLLLCLTCDMPTPAPVPVGPPPRRPGVLVIPKLRDGTPGAVGMEFDGARGAWLEVELAPLPPPKRNGGNNKRSRERNGAAAEDEEEVTL